MFSGSCRPLCLKCPPACRYNLNYVNVYLHGNMPIFLFEYKYSNDLLPVILRTLCKSVCNCSSLSLSCRPDGNECWALRVSLCSYFMNPACMLIAEYWTKEHYLLCGGTNWTKFAHKFTPAPVFLFCSSTSLLVSILFTHKFQSLNSVTANGQATQ